MRVALLSVVIFLAAVNTANGQGNPRDFGRDAMRERLEHYARVQKEVYESVLLRWKSAAERDDVGALAKFYDESATYFPPGLPFVQTRAAVRDYFANFLGKVGDVSVSLIDFGTSGDLAYVTAGMSFYVLNHSEPGRKLTRTDLMVLRRRTSGDWQILTHFSRDES